MALQRHFNLFRELNDSPYKEIESTMQALGGGAVNFSPSTSYIASFLVNTVPNLKTYKSYVIAKIPEMGQERTNDDDTNPCRQITCISVDKILVTRHCHNMIKKERKLLYAVKG